MKCYRTYNALIDSLNTTQGVKDIMNEVKREYFVKEGFTYCDKPLLTIENQTISAPHMHAKALEYLYPVLKEGSEVLDIGSGSGYLTACFATLVNVYSKDISRRGKVIGLEYYQSLVDYSIDTITNHYNHLFKYKSRFKVMEGSGWFGYPKKSKKENYDAIHVGASCDSIPIYLIHQLKKGGLMVLPLKLNNDKFHTFCIIKKDKNNNIHIETKEKVRYVPLIK